MKFQYLKCFSTILFAACCVSQSWADAAPSYRVDVIVFAHTVGGPEQRFTPTLVDFGDFPDPSANARAANWSRPATPLRPTSADQARRDALATLDQLQALENNRQIIGRTLLDGPLFPSQLVGLDELSSTMSRAWDRLLSSTQHRPLVWRSWHQRLSSGQSGPWFRLRGGSILGIDWTAPESISPGLIVEPPPYPFRLPRTSHQIDGIVRLRQRQFMHIDLDLIWQDAVSATPSPLGRGWFRAEGFAADSLEQSRAIRPGRIEYFDSSRLGVLVFVQSVDNTSSP